MGIVRPSAGRILAEIDGERHELSRMATEDIVNLGIALVPEGRRLFPKLTVEENLLLGAFRHKARSQIARNLESCFTTFPRLAERRRQLAGSLSGGEQQMVALGRALMLAPRILLEDVPSVGLAPVLLARPIVATTLLQEQHQLTLLMAAMSFFLALRIPDRGYLLLHGKIAVEGGSAEQLNNIELFKKFYLVL